MADAGIATTLLESDSFLTQKMNLLILLHSVSASSERVGACTVSRMLRSDRLKTRTIATARCLAKQNLIMEPNRSVD